MRNYTIFILTQNSKFSIKNSRNCYFFHKFSVLHNFRPLFPHFLLYTKPIKGLNLGFSKLPVCMAKTQYSFSDDATKLGAPEGFTVTVRDVTLSAGAHFIVVLTGNIMTMPGLPKVPAAERIDVDEDGLITGLF